MRCKAEECGSKTKHLQAAREFTRTERAHPNTRDRGDSNSLGKRKSKQQTPALAAGHTQNTLWRQGSSSLTVIPMLAVSGGGMATLLEIQAAVPPAVPQTTPQAGKIPWRLLGCGLRAGVQGLSPLWLLRTARRGAVTPR